MHQFHSTNIIISQYESNFPGDLLTGGEQIESEEEIVTSPECDSCNRVYEAISSMLRRNRFLKELSVDIYDGDCVSMIADALCDNNSLEKLHLSGSILQLSSIASMLKQNIGLKELQISHFNSPRKYFTPKRKVQDPFSDIIISNFVMLSTSLRCNKTLTNLNIAFAYIPGHHEHNERIKHECSKDSRLTTESGKRLYTLY